MSPPIKEIIQLNSRLQELYAEIEKAVSLKALVLIGFKMGLAVALIIVTEVLVERAHKLTEPPTCPECGRLLHSKGRLPRRIMTLIGYISWKRKVWRCPNDCKIGQVAPFDTELGLRPNQRTGDEVKQMACVLVVFIPFNIAERLLKTLTGIEVSSQAIWVWVQCVGARAMRRSWTL